MIDGQSIWCENVLRWKPLNLTDDKPTLVQVMAWCHQATMLTQIWVTIWHHKMWIKWGRMSMGLTVKYLIIKFICTCQIVNVQILLFYHYADHYSDVIMGTMASQITRLMIVYSTVYSAADQSKYQSSASLAFVWGIHWWPVNSLHKRPVTRKMFPFDDVIMYF